jgi:hypothetical protein
MSWLKPDNIEPSDYDPQAKVVRFLEQHSDLGRRVLEALNSVDPLHALFGNNPDEYVGEAKKIIQGLAGRTVESLTNQEIIKLVGDSFGSSLADGFIEAKSVELIAEQILAVR